MSCGRGALKENDVDINESKFCSLSEDGRYNGDAWCNGFFSNNPRFEAPAYVSSAVAPLFSADRESCYSKVRLYSLF